MSELVFANWTCCISIIWEVTWFNLSPSDGVVWVGLKTTAFLHQNLRLFHNKNTTPIFYNALYAMYTTCSGWVVFFSFCLFFFLAHSFANYSVGYTDRLLHAALLSSIESHTLPAWFLAHIVTVFGRGLARNDRKHGGGQWDKTNTETQVFVQRNPLKVNVKCLSQTILVP